MVIPSDITKWGFIQGADTEGDVAAGFDKTVLAFSSVRWMLFMDKTPMQDVQGTRRAILFFEGKKWGEAFLTSPNEVVAFLKKVGYLSESSPNGQYKNIA